MARLDEYPELLEKVQGRTVLIWTCNTCARLCNVGGKEIAESLASRLSSDGVDVTGVASSSACCLMSKSDRMAQDVDGTYDLVIALCCDAGVINAETSTGVEVLKVLWTYGPGYMDRDGTPRLMPFLNNKGASLGDMCSSDGMHIGPY